MAPPWHFCLINLRSGCYRITFRPNSGITVYYGTMRVDTAGGQTTISGDLYRFLQLPIPWPIPPLSLAQPASLPFPFPFPFQYDIPIYSRSRYYSYLKVTNVQRSPIFTTGPCQLTLTAQEYVYTQPLAGSFDGTFPGTPGTRTVTILLEPKPAPFGFTSSYFEGTLYDGGVAQGSFMMGWVSNSFRKATLEIDTLVGCVAPTAVPALSGSGTENFQTVFATAGWDLKVIYDQVNVPVPAGVNANTCWSNGDLHNLMSAIFGTAANQQEHNVPRAFMRSACHEVGHGFNQIHQEQENGADNSIMTTTPSVADVLGGPTTGAPGVFPDNIALQFNDHVRHHLVHFPDIVVRPGGMTFGSGHLSVVPETDRYYFAPQELELKVDLGATHIELGEPLQLSWTLLNQSSAAIPAPSDISIEAQHTFITVTTPGGRVKPMPSFIIKTEEVKIEPLPSEQALQADTRVYWSSKGFAFETPGKYLLEVRIVWTYGGMPFGVLASTDLWVNYPQLPVDNDAASLLHHPQVGMYVALGGGAPHLTEAITRLERVSALAEGDQPAPKALRGYQGLLPKEKGPMQPA